MNFSTFKAAIAKQFDRLQKHDMYRVQIEKDDLWATYQGSFPSGTNQLFRVRAEHDCSCCRQFIRAVGDAVAVINGEIETVWDISIPSEPAYQAVANSMAALIRSKKIGDLFLHYERKAGTDKTFEEALSGVKTWEHFFVNINSKFVVKGSDIASTLAGPRSIQGVLQRGLTELTLDSLDTVLELIANKSLYRGEEHRFAVDSFRKLKLEFDRLDADQKELFTWKHVNDTVSVTKIRNTAIGTLLIDLSEGKDLEDAVKLFETSIMAPANYKRPTALITTAMIEQAKTKINELGLTSALDRRFATLHDININNILFVDRAARQVINGDVFDELSATAGTKAKKFDKVEEVSIERFVSEIVPRATSLEVLLENQHAGNLVSLIAPVDPTAGSLFKWSNNFSWSYASNMADSIKERVKQAGGSVEGDLCCRLAWDYADDLDFHMIEPKGGHIYFGNRRSPSQNGGVLDVDANGIDGIRENPVENIFYADRKRMSEGVYELSVNNFTRRSDGVGFEVEIEFDGQKFNICYDKALTTKQTVKVAKIKYTKGAGFEVAESLPSSQSVRINWSLASQSFHRVNVLMLSPNYWDEKAVGNKHYFFMLDGCYNDGTARGFFNEFLKEELNAHRKVIEVVGSKLKVSGDEQLSGLGFSSTQKNTLICRVKGSFERIIKVVF